MKQLTLGMFCSGLLLLAPVWAQESPVAAAAGGDAKPVATEHGATSAPGAAPDQSAAATMPAMPAGDAERGRLVFGPCRTCHYPEAIMGHNNGPNLHRIFGKVAGKQEGFDYYSEDFKAAQFVWTPALMYVWLENPMAMFPGSTMMSFGVPDPQQRADLIEYLKQASVREP